MNSRIYGIVVNKSRPISSELFIKKYSELLEEIMEDPDAKILLSDIGSGSIFVARFLKKRYYRNAILHHIGDKPRVNIANLPTKGGFTSHKECQRFIRKNSTDVIRIKSDVKKEGDSL